MILLIYFWGEKFLLALIIVGYLTTPSEYFGNLRIYITLLLSLLLLFLFVKNHGISKLDSVKFSKEAIIFFILLIGVLTLSSIFSQYSSDGFFAVFRTIVLATIFFMIYSLISSIADVYLIILSLLFSVLVYSIRILFDFFIHGAESYFAKSFIESSVASYGSAGYTGLTLFFISISFLFAAFFSERFKSKLKRSLISFLFVFNIIILILANSRGGIIAAAVSICFIIFMLKRTLLIKLTVGVVFAWVILLIFFSTIVDAMELYLRLDQINTREIFWNSGIEIALDNMWFGVGADVFEKYFFNYAPSSVSILVESFSSRFGKSHPHNLFLHYAAENGLLGLLISIGFFVLFFTIAFKTLKLTKNLNREYYVSTVAITGIGFGLFVRSFFEVTGYLYYGFISTDLPFWLTFGILIYIYQHSKT